MKTHPFCIALVSLLAIQAPAPAATGDKLNVLILYADDMGYGDLISNNPNSKIPTPNLDRLAAEGLSFSDGHSSSGICTPSRYALLTGRYHWRDFHGIAQSFGPSVFKKNQLTIPKLLQSHGYNTAAIGKWHLGMGYSAIRNQSVELSKVKPKKGRAKTHYPANAFDWSKPIPDGPLSIGFDHYFGDDVINFPPYAWIEDDKLVKAPDTQMDPAKWPKIKEGNWECRPGPMVTGWNPYEVLPTLGKKGAEYITAQAKENQPFFLYFAFPSPHAPIIPNDEFDGKSKAGPYGDFVYETDHIVGKLLTALEESGQADNTLVIFTADNGSEHYAYPRDAKYDHWSSAPFRGAKRDLYEGGHHVPFIVKLPSVTQPGSRTEALASQVDLFATIAEATGIKLPADRGAEDSFSLMPVLKGGESSGRDAIVHNTRAGAYALRKGDWVLIDTGNGHHNRVTSQWYKKHGVKPEKAPVYLYNLEEDVIQSDNLYQKNPEKLKELKEELKLLRDSKHTAPRLSD
ncbi:arylsulfatase [Verrucomicrobiaceae bacterium R5-34]|uniref:Arylsulfatase n=1 Tax=Oceaniferula flava TaxID=2800421 RepID=A0AAE2SD35_9BACT|nr:arylsulfatase [Oceaniferula flavus]MBK1830748.1 arylsulfatase [Verrucomicrobiaceae bacterium R5-34]MBK1856006.1 arylsulfatase [Oceaniferula flavus]MBM1137313.1 arylsulfatase [Oceaniferula flavus]